MATRWFGTFSNEKGISLPVIGLCIA